MSTTTPELEIERTRSPRRIRGTGFVWLLVLPGLALLIAVVLYPLLRSIAMAFFEESLLYPGREFVGLENFTVVLGEDFPQLLWQTLIFTAGATVLPFLIGLALALALDTGIRGRGVMRGMFLFPWLLPSVVVSFLWSWIFDANYGVLNGLLQSLSLIDAPVAWLFDTEAARAGLILAKTWNSFPWIMVMLLAALQTVPSELKEAASIDGAGAIRRFRTVTWPHIAGVTGIVLLLEVIWNFQHFDLIYVMTGGGPAGTTSTLATALYEAAFSAYDLGEAGAIGVLWIILLMAMVVVYVQLSERSEEPS
ncbi:carbohydrate ABC transporter permease [Brachybacterium paraconglomeratum]|uniref:carbohydrate ABC transporter permease n=1 Tax=Brachybacterium paraconglomeratum TaxID=173362 RepID=UPI0022E64BCE|nr:sugar ABC transporter permease [Brachybacterium paraconglomeratum]